MDRPRVSSYPHIKFALAIAAEEEPFKILSRAELTYSLFPFNSIFSRDLICFRPLEKEVISYGDGKEVSFEIDPFRRTCLLEGLDDIGLTLQHVDDIRAYEEKRKLKEPWLFN